MALHLIAWDTVKNRQKRIPTEYAEGGYSDFDFVVSSDLGQTDFTVVGGTVTSDGKIDCFVNGVQYREGVSTEQWQRNTGANKIVFNASVRKNGVVRVRLYS